MADIQKLTLLKMSVSAIRQQVNEQLDAMEAEIDQLLPEIPPRRQVPASKKGRQSYWKKWARQL